MALTKCPECQFEVSELAPTCPKCGYPISVALPKKQVQYDEGAGMRMLLPVGRSTWAIIAGYLAFLSVLCIPSPFALLAGIMAVIEMRRDPSKHGLGRAIFGIVMGGIGSALLVFFLVIIPKTNPADAHLDNLTHAEAIKRKGAADALGQLKDKRAVEPLIKALSDTDPSVRQTAIKSLAKFKDDRAIAPLLTTSKDADKGTREESLRALALFSDPRIADPMLAALTDEDWTIRHAAVGALERVKDPRAVDGLLTALKDPNMPLQLATIKTLGVYQDPKIVAPLVSLVDSHEPPMVKAAATSLWMILAEGKAAPLRKGILLNEEGKVHEFQSILPAAVQVDAVEKADIVLKLSNQKKTAVSVHPYTNGPSITRYQYDLTVRLVNQRSKKEVVRLFRTNPPPPPESAPIELVALGEPVTRESVSLWAVKYFFEP